MKKQGIRTAFIWVYIVGISLISWLLILVIPRDGFAPIILNNWFGIGDNQIAIRFVLRPENWILVMSLLAYNLAFFLTGTVRLNIKTDFPYWIFQQIITAISFLAVLSADLWSVVLMWTALDLLDLFFQYLTTKRFSPNHLKIIFKFSGSMLLIWNTAILSQSGFNPILDVLVASDKNTLFIAALLHSGIFPIRIEPDKPVLNESAEIIKTFINVINFVVSFSLVTYLPVPELSFLPTIFFGILGSIIGLFSMMRWIFRREIEESISYLLAGWAGLLILQYLAGASSFIIYNLALVMLSILWLMLYSHRSKSLLLFPIIVVFIASGLPFSLVAFGPRAFIGEGVSLSLVISLLVQVLFLIGLLMHAIKIKRDLDNLEIWYQSIFLAGVSLPILSIVAVVVNSVRTFENEIQFWWIGAVVLFTAAAGYFYIGRAKNIESDKFFLEKTGSGWLGKLFAFEWLNHAFVLLEDNIKIFVVGFSGFLEGDGGILWALVILILILTAIR